MWDINNDALGNPLCSKPKVYQKVSMCHNLGEETIDRDTNGCEKVVALNGVGRLSSLCHYWHEMVMLAQTAQALLAFHQFKSELSSQRLASFLLMGDLGYPFMVIILKHTYPHSYHCSQQFQMCDIVRWNGKNTGLFSCFLPKNKGKKSPLPVYDDI